MRTPAKIAGAYLIFGLAWILVTDSILYHFEGQLPLTIMQLAQFKGYLFVVLSALLVFVLVNYGQKAQARSLELAKSVMERLPLGIAVHDMATTKAIFVNRQFSNDYGWPLEELTDVESFFTKVYPDEAYRKRIRDRVERDVASGDASRMHWDDVMITTYTGENRYVDAQNVVLAEHGLMISTVRDVTDRKQLEQGIRKLSRAVEQSPASVMITDLDGNIRYVNPKFEAATGYTSAEVVGRNPRFLKSGHTSTNEYADLWQTISKGETWTGELQNKRKDGTVFWERASIGAVFNENGEIMEYLAVKEDITELKEALDTLEQRVMERTHSLHLATDELSTSNQEIMESIRYAQRIQMAILPSENELKSVITQCFVLFEPRNIVSGDFYWCHDTGKRAFLAMGDCTGHGVPGALLSVIGMELLDKIVIESGVSEPGKVLASLDAAVQRLLKRHDTDVVMNDGMDIAFVCFDHDDSTLHYANAQSFGLLVSKDVCTELEPQKLSIGGHTSQADKVFVTRQLPFAKGDRLYLFSDGYCDQFGGPHGKKFMRKNLRSRIMELQGQSMHQQREALRQSFVDWMGSEFQVDDVTVIGIER
jgi:PAS domain S-box-containing protein